MLCSLPPSQLPSHSISTSFCVCAFFCVFRAFVSKDFDHWSTTSWPSGHAATAMSGLLFLAYVLWRDLGALVMVRPAPLRPPPIRCVSSSLGVPCVVLLFICTWKDCTIGHICSIIDACTLSRCHKEVYTFCMTWVERSVFPFFRVLLKCFGSLAWGGGSCATGLTLCYYPALFLWTR